MAQCLRRSVRREFSVFCTVAPLTHTFVELGKCSKPRRPAELFRSSMGLPMSEHLCPSAILDIFQIAIGNAHMPCIVKTREPCFVYCYNTGHTLLCCYNTRPMAPVMLRHKDHIPVYSEMLECAARPAHVRHVRHVQHMRKTYGTCSTCSTCGLSPRTACECNAASGVSESASTSSSSTSSAEKSANTCSRTPPP